MSDTPTQDSGIVEVRKIVWRDVLPELMLGRCFGIAFQFRAMFLGWIGLTLTWFGWLILYRSLGEPALCPCSETALQALQQGEKCHWSAATLTLYVLDGVWFAIVWSFFGGLLTRSAAIQFTTWRRDRFSLTHRFVVKKFRSYLGTAILPLLAVTATAAIVALNGWITDCVACWSEGAAWTLRIAFGWLTLLFGFLGSLFLVGTVFGFPLMIAAVSTEGTDTFDGVARGFHFLMRRPLRALTDLVLSLIPGVIGGAIVIVFFRTMLFFTASFLGIPLSGGESIGALTILIPHPWLLLIPALMVGYVASYFWTAATAIYLLLRKNLDNTPLDVVLEEEEDATPAKKLPIIRTDTAGAPVMDGTSDQPGQQNGDAPTP